MTIIAGAGILAWIIGIYAVRVGRRMPPVVRAARRARSTWREAAGPVIARIEKRTRILVSDGRAWARQHMVSGTTR